jgi:hypothetical protein
LSKLSFHWIIQGRCWRLGDHIGVDGDLIDHSFAVSRETDPEVLRKHLRTLPTKFSLTISSLQGVVSRMETLTSKGFSHCVAQACLCLRNPCRAAVCATRSMRGSGYCLAARQSPRKQRKAKSYVLIFQRAISGT